MLSRASRQLILSNSVPASKIAVRHMGFFSDTITSMTTKTMESSRKKAFDKMLDLMLNSETWSLRVWKATMDEHLNSWMMYIPGVSSANETKELKVIRDIMQSMTDAELDDATLINGKVKERLAIQSNHPIDQVHRLFVFYNQSRVMQQWLRMKKEKGEPLPQSDVEMQKLASEDPRIKVITQKVLFPDRRKTGRSRSMF